MSMCSTQLSSITNFNNGWGEKREKGCLHNRGIYSEGGSYWSGIAGDLFQNNTQGGGCLLKRGPLIRRRALNQIITDRTCKNKNKQFIFPVLEYYSSEHSY